MYRGSLDSIEALSVLSQSLLISGGDDCCIRIWDTRNGLLKCTLRGAEYPITALCHSRQTTLDSPILRIYAASGKSVVIFEVASEEEHVDVNSPADSFQYNGDEITSLALHPTEELIVSADDDGSIAIVSTKTRRLIKLLNGGTGGHSSLCMCVSFLGKDVLISGGMDGKLICWTTNLWTAASSSHVASSIAESGLEDEDEEEDENYPAPPKSINPPFVNGLAISACGFFVAVCLGDGSVAVHDWDAQGQGRRPPRPLWVSRPFNCAATCIGFVRHCIRSSLRSSEDIDSSTSGGGGGVAESEVAVEDCTEEFLYAVGNDGSFFGWAWGDIIAEIMSRLDAAVSIKGPSQSSPDDVIRKASVSFRGKHSRGPNSVNSLAHAGPCKACATQEGIRRRGVCGGQGILLICDTRKIITTYNLVE